MRPGQTPHWWPENEPWPPRHGPFAWRRRRRRFTRGFGGIVFVGLFLMFAGVMNLLSWLFAGVPGFTVRPARVGLAVMWLLILAAIFRRVMWRVGMPLGDIVGAADRVASGDYSVRASEYGPDWMRGIARAFNTMIGTLQSQDQQRRAMMADIAHELRTPLAVLQGKLEGMIDGVYPRDEAELTAALQETRMLARLVDDLRTLSHSESGMLALQKEPTDLAMLVHDAIGTCSLEAAERQVALHVTIAPDLPAADVDPLRIREVLTNLITNAMHHTPAGGTIAIDASALDRMITVTVSDTGTGIAAVDLPRIFDRFYKGRGSRGSGLGLTIARSLVVAHGGEIRATSVEGKGTTITFSLPAQPLDS